MRPAMPASAEEIQHAQLSFGDALRRERELRRVALRDVSDATKINLRYLEALERNDFTYLPAGVFTRDIVRYGCTRARMRKRNLPSSLFTKKPLS